MEGWECARGAPKHAKVRAVIGAAQHEHDANDFQRVKDFRDAKNWPTYQCFAYALTRRMHTVLWTRVKNLQKIHPVYAPFRCVDVLAKCRKPSFDKVAEGGKTPFVATHVNARM